MDEGLQPQKIVQLHPAMAGALGLPPAIGAGHETAAFMPGPEGQPVAIRIQPRDCVEDDEILGNVKFHLKRLAENEWVERWRAHDKEAIIVSGGPSVKRHLEEIRKRQAAGAYVFCVKHAYPLLVKSGILPYAVVILDPRPFKGTSTHGYVRKDLLRDIRRGPRYLIASMTHPDVTKHILKKGGRVIGWHAYTGTLMKSGILGLDAMTITGGTCSAFRSIGVAYTMGFRVFHLFGFDLCYDATKIDVDAKAPDGRPKYMHISVLPGQPPKWYSSGELIAAAQDAKELFSKVQQGHIDIDLAVHGEGIVPDIFKQFDLKMRTPARLAA